MRLYEYAPLVKDGNFRLVTILPGQLNDPIRVEIKTNTSYLPRPAKPPEGYSTYETLEGHVLFSNRTRSRWGTAPDDFDRFDGDPLLEDEEPAGVKYEALSYTWGATGKHMSVWVGDGDSQELPVLPNLEDALRHLRYADRPRTMWIDSICINQWDNEERAREVKRMGFIYSNASRVVAWLGPSFPGSHEAFYRLSHIGRQIVLTTDGSTLPAPFSMEDYWRREAWFTNAKPYEYDAIARLCSSEYFYRLWVVQEIQLGNSKTILKCGRDEMPWPHFRRAIVCMGAKLHGVPRNVQTAIVWPRDLCTSQQGRTLHETLYDFRGRKCADYRDKVYGLMNLFDTNAAKHVVVDYSARRSASDTFKHVFWTFVEEENRLSQLRFGGLRHRSNMAIPTQTPEVLKSEADSGPTWPTWLPQWSQNIRTTISPEIGFCASGISASHAKNVNGNEAVVVGVRFATVSTISEPLGSDPGILDIVGLLRTLGLKQLQTFRYPTGETHLDAYIQTFSLGQLKERVPWSYLKYPGLSAVREEIDESEEDAKDLTEHCSPPAYFHNIAAGWLPGCCVFTLSNGYIGMICGRPQIGDQIFIIPGCDVPLLLRPTSRGKYEVVGDYYVHGIMDGEVLLGALPPSWQINVWANKRNGRSEHRFNNRDQCLSTRQDPRVDAIALPDEWENVDFEWSRSDPVHCKKFRNKETGKVINSDPRLFPEALRARGVSLETITLV
ncbi:HET-domain-containing protein [Xylariaceae sp. FL1272]|nr:HET-domain-containing protein [Xylariaceae sp. FL1272]